MKSYTLNDVFVTAGGDTKTLAEWQGNMDELEVTEVKDADGALFEYDSPTGNPANVVVFVAGRPDSESTEEDA